MKSITLGLVIAARSFTLAVPAADTNTLALYLGATNVTQYAIQTGHIRPENLKLDAQPIFTSEDFLSYDPATLTFKVKTKAVERLVKVWPHRGPFEVQEGALFLNGADRPFLLCANGKPVYSGMLTGSGFSSMISCSWSPPPSRSYPQLRPVHLMLRPSETNAATFTVEAPFNLAEDTPDPRKSKAVLNAAKKLGIIAN